MCENHLHEKSTVPVSRQCLYLVASFVLEIYPASCSHKLYKTPKNNKHKTFNVDITCMI